MEDAGGQGHSVRKSWTQLGHSWTLQNKQNTFWLFSFLFVLVLTAIHQGLSKYLTAINSHIIPTSTKYSRTLSSHGNLKSILSQSIMQKIRLFLCLVLSKLIRKLVIALTWKNLNSSCPFLNSRFRHCMQLVRMAYP